MGIVVKLAKAFQGSNVYLPYPATWVWWSQVTFSGYTQPSEYDGTDFDFTQPPLNQTDVDISTTFIDNVSYKQVSTLPECIALEESFFYDFATQRHYIHIDHTKRMDTSEFNNQSVQGYAKDSVFYDDNNIEYLPLITGSSSISDRADRLVYDRMAFIGNSITFDNSEGEFDSNIDSPVPGADVKILFISDADIAAGKRTLTPFYTGFAQADNISLEEYAVDVQDKRSQYNVLCPITRLNATDFPNIEPDLIETPIPEGYGDIIGAPAFVTNGTITTGDVTYKYATDGTSITTIYVKTEDNWNAVSAVSTDPTNGEYTLSAANARDTNGNALESKVDARFRALDSPGEIMEDMISRYLGFTFIPEFFDTDQWNTESALLADIYLHLGGPKPFFEYIEEIQNATDYGFRFFVNAEGKFSLIVDDINRAVSAEYMSIDNMSDLIPSNRDFTEYATTVQVNYSQDISDKTTLSIINTDYQDTTEDTYRFPQERTYTSNLKNSTDANNKAARIALDYSVARNQVTFTLDELVKHNIYDIITIDTSEYRGSTKVREYMGIRKLKLSGIDQDFDLEQTTLTGFDITDI